MPIHLDSRDDDSDVDVTPGTNQARVLRFLHAETGFGFTPKEIADRTDVTRESIYTVLGRLRDKGLVGRTSAGYYHALDDNDEVVRIVRSLRSPDDSAERNPDPTSDEQRTGGTGTPETPPGRTEPDDEAGLSTSNAPAELGGSTGLPPDEAFRLLGNETRVGILQALWDAFESGTGENVISFSELFERVAIRDSGNFSYHLEKLTGPFVRQTDQGYELKQTGINVVRAVVAGTVIDDPAFGPTPVDVACPLCDAPVEITYGDELVTVHCTACVGLRRWNDKPGFLFAGLVPPVGIGQRPVEDSFRAAVVYTMYQIAALHDGTCPHCSSRPETTVDVCTDHRPSRGALCPNCGWTHMAEVWMVCSTCKRSVFPPVRGVVLNDPRVTAFYHEHGVEHRFASWETVARSTDVDEELLSEDPLRMRVTIPAGGDELQLTVDDELNVLDVTP